METIDWEKALIAHERRMEVKLIEGLFSQALRRL